MNAAEARRGFYRQVAPGLEIRLFQPADAESVFALVEQNRDYLRAWLPWVDRTQSAEDVRQFITQMVTPQWLDDRGPQCGIWVEGAIQGSIGCHPIDWQNRGCSIGYWVTAQRQGEGIVTRAVATMLDYLFGEVEVHRVVIQCGTGNHRSCAVPLRLGFTREGVAREAEWVSGRWVDLVVWSLLKSEWRGANLRNQRSTSPT
ncbi:MAG TPA: GNAT family protein [Bryobacteraceae bacterium]|nr:GNAT family protein [Bryobacteraceae bacterium]